MKVKELKELLNRLNDEYDICLTGEEDDTLYAIQSIEQVDDEKIYVVK